MTRSVYTPSLAAQGPLVLRIADAIRTDVVRGRLRSGERLPGSRALATRLRVNRGTVLAAIRELESEGWIRSVEGSGSFIAANLPIRRAKPVAGAALPQPPEAPGFDVDAFPIHESWSSTPGLVELSSGRPDMDLLPSPEIGRAWRRVMARSGAALSDYGDPAGHPALRNAVATLLAERRGLAVDADHILVTRGSQMGLFLTAQTLIRPGDRVAVEALGYRPAWAAFQAAGAELVPVPVDANGLVVDAIPNGVRAVYTTPHHQFPTGVVMSASRRLRLLQRASLERFAVIEDDYDNEFHWEGRPILPLASADTAGVVVYVGSLSKVYAPGLRVGYIAAPKAMIPVMSNRRRVIDRQGDQVLERAVAELIDDGSLSRQIRRMHRVYRQRRQVLLGALRRDLCGVVDVEPLPPGGMCLWASVAEGVDPVQWAARAAGVGIALATGRDFAFHATTVPSAVRFGFCALDAGDLDSAVRRLASVVPRSNPIPSGTLTGSLDPFQPAPP